MRKSMSTEELKECCKDPNFCAVCECSRTDIRVDGHVCKECQQGGNGRPRMLPRVTFDNGKTYFIDERLKQLRNVENPHDFIDF